MASDRLARQLLNMTSDPNVADPVKLAAIRDALDRSGIQAKNAVTVEVSTKPYELVFDRIGSAPRESTTPALETGANSLDEYSDNQLSESVDAFQFPGEIEADENEIDAEVVDVIEEYTDADRLSVAEGSGTAYPPDVSSSLSVELSGTNSWEWTDVT
jgi:hypothetical protein